MRAEANIVNSINWFLLCEHLILAAVSCVPFFERERFSSPFNIFLTQSVRGAKRLQFGCILLFAEAYEKCISARKCVCSLWIAQNFILKEAATARSNNLLKINFQHSLLMLYLFKVSLSFCFIVRCARFAIHRRIGGSVRSFAVYSSVTDRGAFTDLSQERERKIEIVRNHRNKKEATTKLTDIGVSSSAFAALYAVRSFPWLILCERNWFAISLGYWTAHRYQSSAHGHDVNIVQTIAVCTT